MYINNEHRLAYFIIISNRCKTISTESTLIETIILKLLISAEFIENTMCSTSIKAMHHSTKLFLQHIYILLTA